MSDEPTKGWPDSRRWVRYLFEDASWVVSSCFAKTGRALSLIVAVLVLLSNFTSLIGGYISLYISSVMKMMKKVTVRCAGCLGGERQSAMADFMETGSEILEDLQEIIRAGSRRIAYYGVLLTMLGLFVSNFVLVLAGSMSLVQLLIAAEHGFVLKEDRNVHEFVIFAIIPPFLVMWTFIVWVALSRIVDAINLVLKTNSLDEFGEKSLISQRKRRMTVGSLRTSFLQMTRTPLQGDTGSSRENLTDNMIQDEE